MHTAGRIFALYAGHPEQFAEKFVQVRIFAPIRLGNHHSIRDQGTEDQTVKFTDMVRGQDIFPVGIVGFVDAFHIKDPAGTFKEFGTVLRVLTMITDDPEDLRYDIYSLFCGKTVNPAIFPDQSIQSGAVKRSSFVHSKSPLYSSYRLMQLWPEKSICRLNSSDFTMF